MSRRQRDIYSSKFAYSELNPLCRHNQEPLKILVTMKSQIKFVRCLESWLEHFPQMESYSQVRKLSRKKIACGLVCESTIAGAGTDWVSGCPHYPRVPASPHPGVVLFGVQPNSHYLDSFNIHGLIITYIRAMRLRQSTDYASQTKAYTIPVSMGCRCIIPLCYVAWQTAFCSNPTRMLRAASWFPQFPLYST